MVKIISLKCPECGADISIEEGHKQCFCQFSVWGYMAGLSTFALVIINSVVPELRYDEKTEEEEL